MSLKALESAELILRNIEFSEDNKYIYIYIYIYILVVGRYRR